jgi:hypothetical protein
MDNAFPENVPFTKGPNAKRFELNADMHSFMTLKRAFAMDRFNRRNLEPINSRQ